MNDLSKLLLPIWLFGQQVQEPGVAAGASPGCVHVDHAEGFVLADHAVG